MLSSASLKRFWCSRPYKKSYLWPQPEVHVPTSPPNQLEGDTEPYTPTGNCKTHLPSNSLARKRFIWNQNMLWLRTSLKTMLQNQRHQIKENLSWSSTAPALTVTCLSELHLVLPTVHSASHKQLWCQLLNSPERTPTSVWHKTKREQDLGVVRHQTKPTDL